MNRFDDVQLKWCLVGTEKARIGSLGLAARRIIVINVGSETVWITLEESGQGGRSFPLPPSPMDGGGGIYSMGSPDDGKMNCSGVPRCLFAECKTAGQLLVIEVCGPSDNEDGQPDKGGVAMPEYHKVSEMTMDDVIEALAGDGFCFVNEESFSLSLDSLTCEMCGAEGQMLVFDAKHPERMDEGSTQWSICPDRPQCRERKKARIVKRQADVLRFFVA